jgi:glycosyltransferase involved in cell wall biosynthesis
MLFRITGEKRRRRVLFEILQMPNQLHIGVLTGRAPYPNGMAAAQRIHLIARAMAEAGAHVNVWVDGLDRWTEARNFDATGAKDGIPYEYILGKTQASSHKWRRVFDRLALAWEARRRMAEAACSQTLDGLYFFTPCSELVFERLVVRNVAGKKKFPVVVDLCEAPWTLKPKQSFFEKIMSPLWGADGVICISRFLEDWVQQENTRTGRNVRHILVPILGDINEIVPANSPPVGKTVLFAGSPAYVETLRFLLATMEVVWMTHADCQLVITGGATEATLGPAIKGSAGKIRCTGYVERGSLLQEYSAASVLAIPLFDDVKSRARFPTKLWEYLASGRPVVTNRVGEIPRFLEDGTSASFTEPGDVASFANAICHLLEHPAIGQAMGRKGRQVAQRHFHYANYGAKLYEFFSSLEVVR